MARTEARYRLYSEASLQRLRTIKELRARKHSLERIKALLDKGVDEVLVEAAQLQAQLDHMLVAVHDLQRIPMDNQARGILTALALKGMGLAQHLLIILNEERIGTL